MTRDTVRPSAGVYLRVPGEPRGQDRPRIDTRGRRPRTFTDPRTEGYAAQVQAVWLAAGQPRLHAGPYRVHVVAHLKRPAGHFRRSGGLSAAGVRSPRPTRKPDLDNVAKLVLDALASVAAIPDDAGVVELRCEKHWAPDGPLLEFYATSLVEELEAVA